MSSSLKPNDHEPECLWYPPMDFGLPFSLSTMSSCVRHIDNRAPDCYLWQELPPLVSGLC